MRKRIGIFCMAAVLVLGSGCGTESTATGTVTESEVTAEQESDHSNEWKRNDASAGRAERR